MTSLFLNVFPLPRQTQRLQLLSILFNSIYLHLFPGGMQVAAHTFGCDRLRGIFSWFFFLRIRWILTPS